jgi:hypothetical protein
MGSALHSPCGEEERLRKIECKIGKFVFSFPKCRLERVGRQASERIEAEIRYFRSTSTSCAGVSYLYLLIYSVHLSVFSFIIVYFQHGGATSKGSLRGYCRRVCFLSLENFIGMD